MWEFCLISALGDKENLQALEKINIVTPTSNLSDDAKFTLLDFRVGALGSCVGFSDEMGKVNTFAETISSSVVPFSSCPQSLPASESFPMSQLFA
uniref:V-type proton ATPase subunit C n=1 Tax=Bos indicus x Bos taurus TaxID=30522 RepID=A0A4W2HZZ7_BOBOX